MSVAATAKLRRTKALSAPERGIRETAARRRRQLREIAVISSGKELQLGATVRRMFGFVIRTGYTERQRDKQIS